MSVTIKLKNGSGSDPSASDLVVGELAIRTDSGKLFTKKDNGSVAEISGGSGTGLDDGDKGDITVSNGGDTFTIDSGVVTSAKIADGTIVNADINASAAIAGTKISPDFGSQTIETTGATNLSELLTVTRTSSSGQDPILKALHSNLTQGIALGYNTISAVGSNTNVDLNIASKGSGHINMKDNLDCEAGLDVTGNIGVSGTVDGRDVASDGTKLDGIESNATADQTAAEIRTLVESASDSNVFTDADHSKLNGIEASATADQTAAEIRTLVGNASDSNVFTDALLSKLNGIAASATNVTNNNQLTNGAGYITATLTNEQVQDIVGSMVSSNTESGITVTYQDSDGTLDFSVASQTDNNFTNADHSKLDGIESGATADQSNSEIKTAYEANSNTNAFTDALLSKLNGIAASATNVTNNNQLTNGAGYITATLTNEQVQDIVGGMVSSNTESGITVTYQDGDGTLDFSVASQTDNNFTNADHSKLDGIESGATADQTASEIRTLVGNASDSNVFTDALLSKLNGIASSATNVTNNNQLTNGAGYITTATVAGGCVYENSQTISSNYTVSDGKNAMSAGPISIADGVTVTIGDGETYTII